jgi:hypothetical protein
MPTSLAATTMAATAPEQGAGRSAAGGFPLVKVDRPIEDEGIGLEDTSSAAFLLKNPRRNLQNNPRSLA